MTVAEKLQPIVDAAYNAVARYGRPKSQATYENIPAYQAHVAAELANGGGDPYSAPETSPKNAMRVSMVYSCVRVICSGVSQIPLHVYDRQENGDRVRSAPQVDALLNRSPSPTWTAPSFWEYLVTSMLLTGTGYAAIERDAAMNPIALHPLPPGSVKPKHDDVFGIVYEIRMPDSAMQEIPFANMLVVPNCGWDGLRAPSVLQTGLRNALDLNREQDRYRPRDTWKREALGSFAVVQEGQWTSDDIKEYIKMWNEEYGQGNKSRGKPLLFPKSSRIERLSVSLEDSSATRFAPTLGKPDPECFRRSFGDVRRRAVGFLLGHRGADSGVLVRPLDACAHTSSHRRGMHQETGVRRTEIRPRKHGRIRAGNRRNPLQRLRHGAGRRIPDRERGKENGGPSQAGRRRVRHSATRRFHA